MTVNKAILGKAFKKEAATVTALLNDLSDEDKLAMKEQLEGGDTYKVQFYLNETNIIFIRVTNFNFLTSLSVLTLMISFPSCPTTDHPTRSRKPCSV